MTFRCPIDGRELADGKPCPEHHIAFSAPADPGSRQTVAKARAITTDDAPRKRAPRARKATTR